MGFDRSGIMKELLGMNGDQSDTDYDGEAQAAKILW